MQQSRDERDSVIDVTTSLREALSERDTLTPKQEQKPEPEQEAHSGRTFDFEKEPDKLNALVSDAMKDIQEEIDLQSLVNDAMVEFQGIHQEMEKQHQREKARQYAAQHNTRSPDRGWER